MKNAFTEKTNAELEKTFKVDKENKMAVETKKKLEEFYSFEK